ncbi:hypothetical protein VaNZ11_003665, partial [Volvox africanus]
INLPFSMALGFGSQQLSTKSVQLGSAAIQAHRHSRRCLSIGGRFGRLLDANVLDSGQSMRYRPGLVFALKTELPLVQRCVDPTDPLTHHNDFVRYRFVVPQYVTTFGQTLRVVGSLPELGGWNPYSAPSMTWSDGHQWSLECTLPQCSFEFKITVFEGQAVKWEGGSNRVVHAEDAGGDIVPVEIVVWLTCNFNATTNTQMQLAVPRGNIQDTYETGKATLEFLKLRKSKLGHDTEQDSSPEARLQYTAELARLTEAVAEQSTVVHQLSDWLGHEAATSRGASRRNGSSSTAAYTEDEENSLLLLAIDSVRVPRALRRISFVQPPWTSGLTAALSSGKESAEKSDGTEVKGAPTNSPFLRGELDSRADDIMGAAEVLLQELKQSSSPDVQQASLDWASLAQEAGQVAVALEALGGDDSPTDHALQRQLRRFAAVGCELAGGNMAAVVATEATAVSIDVDSSTQISATETGVPLVLTNLQDAVVPPSASTAVEVAASNTGGQLVPPLTSPSPSPPGPVEASPWQRLAANMKDTLGVNGPLPVVAFEQEAVQRIESNGQSQQALIEQNGTGQLEPWKPDPNPLQQEAPVGTVRGWRWPKLNFNLRAFLDSLFL